ncbi:hypothetical protein [Streptomyces sp. HB2AG]|uniref:hypothetical protein n=1 Tax=Streptomyces sp. HB2AG TaxID=2983400 RepID=UPI0022AB2D3F|nr:hypothetical protein [Streptomyces sp. HB2AG]MCZ2523348.1 hypothetical protein [Streptomyces sp. HB2AG]
MRKYARTATVSGARTTVSIVSLTAFVKSRSSASPDTCRTRLGSYPGEPGAFAIELLAASTACSPCRADSPRDSASASHSFRKKRSSSRM